MPTSIPTACGVPRESRNESDPFNRHPRRHSRAKLLGLFHELREVARPVLVLGFHGGGLGPGDRVVDRAPEVGQADGAEDGDQDGHKRHEPDHPAPDQLEAADRLGDHRVNRLLLDVRGQAQGSEDGHHDRQEQRAEQDQCGDVKPAHLGGTRGLKEPVSKRQYQREDDEDHPGGPHPAVGLVDAQTGDRINSATAHRHQLTDKEREDSPENRIAHVGYAQPETVDQPVRQGRFLVGHEGWQQVRPLHQDPYGQAQKNCQVHTHEHQNVGSLAEPENGSPQADLDPEHDDQCNEARQQAGQQHGAYRVNRHLLGRLEGPDQHR